MRPLVSQNSSVRIFSRFSYIPIISVPKRTRIFWAFNGMREGPGAGNRVLAPTLQPPIFVVFGCFFVCRRLFGCRVVLLRFCSIRELFSTVEDPPPSQSRITSCEFLHTVRWTEPHGGEGIRIGPRRPLQYSHFHPYHGKEAGC